jgi:secreted trypsin-like serine protease
MELSRRLIGIMVVVSTLTMLLSGTTYAISNGQPDGDAHPYVGWVVVWDGESPWVYLGTGSLIAPNVVLTAGHVVADEPDYIIKYVWVAFDAYAVWSPLSHPRDWNVAESWQTHPDYEIGVDPQLKDWISHDVGIIILDKKVRMGTYGELPEEGLVDTLEMHTPVDQVGYGVQMMVHVPGTGAPYWDYIEFGARYQLIESEHEFSDEFLKLTANAAQEKGGTCYGDSGGPNLLGGTDTILAVTSWGTNYNCAGVSYVARVDTADVLNWIYDEFGEYLE